MTETVQRRGLSGSALKWIAIVTMLIDHMGAVLVWNWFLESPTAFHAELYNGMRTIGRIAFPIFCFLLTEGFVYTRDRKKYALRLGLFCLIAELPFDLAVWEKVPYWEGQNVFFTLFLGFLAIWVGEELSKRLNWHIVPAVGVSACVFGCLAELLQTDYGFFGVLLIAALDLGRALGGESEQKRKLFRLGLGALAILWYCWSADNWIELYAVLGLALTMHYNGERGNGPKWFFYWFYPIHLALLGIVNYLLF